MNNKPDTENIDKSCWRGARGRVRERRPEMNACVFVASSAMPWTALCCFCCVCVRASRQDLLSRHLLICFPPTFQIRKIFSRQIFLIHRSRIRHIIRSTPLAPGDHNIMDNQSGPWNMELLTTINITSDCQQHQHRESL